MQPVTNSLVKSLSVRFRSLLIIAITLAPYSARADWTTGFITDVDTSGIGVVTEYHGSHWIQGSNWSISKAAALRLDQDGDAWAGAGASGVYVLNQKWQIESSFMPGLYKPGETDLGGNLQFRSKIGLSYLFREKVRVSISVDHLSNGRLRSYNPGSDAITLGFQFVGDRGFGF